LLVETLQHKDPDTRLAAAEMLGEIGDTGRMHGARDAKKEILGYLPPPVSPCSACGA
jgi:HEAT repeat protein